MISLYRYATSVKKNFIKPYNMILKRQKNYVSLQLVEVGHFETPKIEPHEIYEPGQLFVHKQFAYRGIILFPWYARVLDKDISDLSALDYLGDRKKRYNKKSFYYQVLIDIRDRHFLKNFTQFEAVTFLGSANGNDHGICSLPGMDYVSHEDILPFTSTARHSIHHELFDNFFTYKPGKELCFSGKNTLKAWEKKNTSWLDLSQVYKKTSDNVRVTAIPFYIGYQKKKHTNSLKYWWRYQIRLENYSTFQMQLRSHSWRIFNSVGIIEKVRGQGVVGLEPFLCRQFPTFQYNSHVSLHTPKGHMWGTYVMEMENGKSIECNVPLFVLESKYDDTLSSHQYDNL